MSVHPRQSGVLSLKSAALLLLSLLASACSSSGPASTPAPAPASPTSTPTSTPLWGEMKPVVSVKELMRYMIDPISDNVFNAVSTVVTKQGTVETAPKTDEDWE